MSLKVVHATSLNLIYAYYEEHEQAIIKCPSSLSISAKENVMRPLNREKIIIMTMFTFLYKTLISHQYRYSICDTYNQLRFLYQNPDNQYIT